MDSMKTGRLIARLRKEKGLTQKDIAQSLGVVNKTVSKWECGLGCPDLSLWPALSQILGADMAQMMEGEIVRNRPDSGNLCKARFYVCADCGNVLVSTAGASVFCCGRKLEAAAAQDAQEGSVAFSQVDGEWFVQIDHPMEKRITFPLPRWLRETRFCSCAFIRSRRRSCVCPLRGWAGCFSTARATGCFPPRYPGRRAGIKRLGFNAQTQARSCGQPAPDAFLLHACRTQGKHRL